MFFENAVQRFGIATIFVFEHDNVVAIGIELRNDDRAGATISFGTSFFCPGSAQVFSQELQDRARWVDFLNFDNFAIEHEASVSKIADEQLFYLMSRGLTEAEASSMIVTGFIEPLVKELPMEYAVEMNRLIELQMEGSVG